MGYTHYWSLKEKPTRAAWQAYIAAVEAVLDSTATRLAYEYDAPRKPPEVSMAQVRFNGVGDNGHETFIVRPEVTDFEFCKTAQKPYDAEVVACLILANYYLPTFSWSSDGSKRNFQRGLGLAIEAQSAVGEGNLASDREG